MIDGKVTSGEITCDYYRVIPQDWKRGHWKFPTEAHQSHTCTWATATHGTSQRHVEFGQYA